MCRVCRVILLPDTAQVELKSERVKVPAPDLPHEHSASVLIRLVVRHGIAAQIEIESKN